MHCAQQNIIIIQYLILIYIPRVWTSNFLFENTNIDAHTAKETTNS